MKNKLIYYLIMLIFIAGGCTSVIDPSQKEKSTDLVVPGDFDWKTSQDVKITVSGLPLPDDFYSTLKIENNDKKVIFSCNYNLRDNLVLTLTLPVTDTGLVLTYGGRTIKGSIEKGRIDFAFTQKDDKSDLGQ